MEDIIFHRTGNFWFDCGTVAFYNFFNDYKDELTNERANELTLELQNDKLIIKSPLEKDKTKQILEEVYMLLCRDYYSISTKKQIDETGNYNLIYNLKEKTFRAIPKKKSNGIGEMIFPRPTRPLNINLDRKLNYDKKSYGLS